MFRELVILKRDIASAASPTIRSFAKTLSAQGRLTEHIISECASKMMDEALNELGKLKDDQLKDKLDIFIRDCMQPCRGNFPDLYRVAERGLSKLNLNKQQNLSI